MYKKNKVQRESKRKGVEGGEGGGRERRNRNEEADRTRWNDKRKERVLG